MPDDEFNEALEETAEAINEVSAESYRNRRKALNVAARQRGIIQEGEDIINEYRGTGIGALNGVESWLQGELENSEDILILLNDIEQHQNSKKDQENSWLRRNYGKAALGALLVGGVLGWRSQGEPNYISDTVQMEPSEFQNIFDELPRSYQNDILPGGTTGNQYQAWFNEDDYEDLLSATLFYEEDSQKDSSMLYEHRLGDDETDTRRIIENSDAAERFYREAIQ